MILEYALSAALATLYAENSAGHPRTSTVPASKSLRTCPAAHLASPRQAVSVVQLLLQLLDHF
jgi:hypothetical protein